jgi:hypothetical protein
LLSAFEASQAVASPGEPEVKAVVPAITGSIPENSLSSVSCGSSGNCSAVGSYYDSSDTLQALFLNQSGGKWASGVEATLPANRIGASLASVSCASAEACSAVGSSFESSGHSQGVLLSETAGAWAPGIEATPPANAGSIPDVFFSSVSCASPANCSAVGGYTDSSGHSQGLLLSEIAGAWAPGIEATLPANAGPNPEVSLTSVSCVSAGNCTAVGSYTDSSGDGQGVLLSEIAGTWAPGIEATVPASAAANPLVHLASVSCASAGNCTAVGGYAASDAPEHGLLLNENAGTWAPGIEATLPANGAGSSLVSSFVDSVSCASAGNCTAVGNCNCGLFASSPNGLLLTESAGTWATGVEATPPGNTSFDVTLSSVSCAAAGNCSAAGAYGEFCMEHCQAFSNGLLLNQSGGAWGAGIEAIPPANASEVSVNSVSCASAGNCSAVGSHLCGYPGLLLSETAGTWAPGIQAPLPANALPSNAGCPTPQQAVLSRLRISPKTFVLAGRRVKGHCVKQTTKDRIHRRCIRPITLHVSYTLSSPATVPFTVKRRAPGRRANGRCAKPTNRNKRQRGCTRLLSLPGKISVSGASGANSFTFRGRIGGKRLGPGSYQLTATPQANGQAGTSQTIKFKIAA